MLGALDDDAVAAFIAAAGPGSGSPLIAAGLRHLGGALAEAPDGRRARSAAWTATGPCSWSACR